MIVAIRYCVIYILIQKTSVQNVKIEYVRIAQLNARNATKFIASNVGSMEHYVKDVNIESVVSAYSNNVRIAGLKFAMDAN